MNETMSLIVVKKTGSVVGAVTCNANAELTPEAVAGKGLLVRGFLDPTAMSPTVRVEQFVIPADQLEIFVTDFDQVVSFAPRSYFIEEINGKKEVKKVSGNSPTITLTDSQATVRAPAVVTKDTDVWIQIEGGPLTSPRVYRDQIKKDAQNVVIVLDKILDPGRYVAIASIPGNPTRVDSFQL